MNSWKTIWKQWSLSDRPQDFDKVAQDRYGLLPSSRRDDPFPVGISELKTAFGPVLGNNCLLCHAGKIAGQTVIGLGNASLDFQSLQEDLQAGELLPLRLPFQIGNGRGIIEAGAGTTYLLQFRDAEMNPARMRPLKFSDQLCQDLPAWWLLKSKKTMFHGGMTDARSVRANVSFFLAPNFGAEFIKQQEAVIADIREYLLTLEAPKYPFPIDRALAARGEDVFVRNCAECHGTYGANRHYPNRIIPVEEVGTDPALATFDAGADRDYFEASWLYRETGPDGEPYHLLNHGGYQAPPLDGVWATAPYFHNASVPTIAHVLDSQTRPAVFTRSFETDAEAYDQQRVGWKITLLEPDAAKRAAAHEQRRITNTALPGRGNRGHTFGDSLTPDQRTAVLEYLKTL
ncbi:MAG TPA: hypothetical protein VM165_00545 [Planctomycetaceae bacterium]|nr:hypothetical protein [Planctomycetaceae bacterium]